MTPSPALMTDGVGRRFELVSLLGEGGFGEVYLCRMTSPGGLEQAVAVKLLHKGLDPKSQAVERLRDEARTLASLRHPVLLAALDLVELGGRVALVTEFVEGQDLYACIDGPDRMPIGPLLEAIGLVAGALDAAWQQLRVVHRDIKPANIRVGMHGNVKLLDFGIARSALGDRAAKTESAMLVGTLRYMAPERFEADQTPLPASDVFALGCVLYEGLTDEALFAEKTITEVCRLAMMPEHWTAFVEQRLAVLALADAPMALLREMLAHDAASRPTPGALMRRCEDLVDTLAGQIPLSRWCRDRRWPPSPLSKDSAPEAVGEEGTRWQIATPVVPTRLAPTPSVPTSAPPTPSLAPTGSSSNSSLLLPVESTLPAVPSTRSGAKPGPTTGPISGVWLAKRAAATAAVFGTLLTGAAAVLLVVGITVAAGYLGSNAGAREEEKVLVAPVPELPLPAPVAPVLLAPVGNHEPTDRLEPAEKPEVPVVQPHVQPNHVVPHVPDVKPVPEVKPVSEVKPEVPAIKPAHESEAPAQAVSSYSVTLSSIPGGAEVRLVRSGKLLGTTPLVQPLPAGEVAVRMTTPDGASIERTLVVGKNAPTRYVWRVAEGRVDAGY